MLGGSPLLLGAATSALWPRVEAGGQALETRPALAAPWSAHRSPLPQAPGPAK